MSIVQFTVGGLHHWAKDEIFTLDYPSPSVGLSGRCDSRINIVYPYKVNAIFSHKQTMIKILLLFHSKSIRNSLVERLQFENFTTIEADSEQTAHEICSSTPCDAAIVGSDISLDNLDVPKIVIGQEPNIETALAAVRHGAIDYPSTPIDMNRLLWRLRSIDDMGDEEPMRCRPLQRSSVKRTNCATQPIIGCSSAIEHVRRMIQRVAPSDARVLVLGENGTGKEPCGAMAAP